ncbi:MAG: beta-hydroxyacyl-ACP dehydratase [Planctomycetota bacterium]
MLGRDPGDTDVLQFPTTSISLGHTRPTVMQYRQIDEITKLQPGVCLEGKRTLHAEEQYLADHFPRFPVMPGVMMLEALHQAAVWMIRTGEDFASPLVRLVETKNVKFGDFLSPGETLHLYAEKVKEDDQGRVTVKARAEKDGRTTVSARLILQKESTNEPEHLGTDAEVIRCAREQFLDLFGPVERYTESQMTDAGTLQTST